VPKARLSWAEQVRPIRDGMRGALNNAALSSGRGKGGRVELKIWKTVYALEQVAVLSIMLITLYSSGNEYSFSGISSPFCRRSAVW